MGRLAEIQRKVLEQMMGPEAMGYTPVNVDWWSEKVCRNFLFGTCPHLIFTNTKMDLGPCPKLHSDRVLTQFKAARDANPSDPRFMQYEQEHQNSIYSFVEECDRKIRMSQRRLEKTPEENKKTVDLMREVGEIELAIQGGTEEIEQLGEAGKVEESMAKLAAVDALKTLKQEKERDLQTLTETAGASGHQKLRVCETCGAYLSILDSDRRLADHFGGKMHLGYHELRKLLEGFQEKRMAQRNAPPPQMQHYQPMQNKPPVPPFNAPTGPAPHTPLDGPKLPPAGELPGAGHGVKAEREAGELVEDLSTRRSDRDRYESRSSRHDSRDRDRSDREREHRDRDGRSDRDRSDRDRDRHRDRDRDGDRRESKSSRSRSPRRR